MEVFHSPAFLLVGLLVVIVGAVAGLLLSRAFRTYRHDTQAWIKRYEDGFYEDLRSTF